MSDRSSPSADQIHQVLRGLRCAGVKSDPLQAGIIGRVSACDGYVRVQVDPEAIPATDRGEVRQNIEAMVNTLPGIRQVTVEWVEGEDDAPADRPAPHPPARVQGNQQEHAHGHAHGHDHGHDHGQPGHAHGAGPMEQAALTGVKHVIAVGAGKGGVGKSTISVLLAVGLARRGLRVGLMDADVYGPSIPKMLGVESAKPTVQRDQIVPIVACDLKIMSIGFMIPPDQAVIWRGPMIHGTIKQFLDNVDWGELDYLIVDLPPGTGDVPLTLSQSIPLTGAVVVCTPQDVALLDAMRAARMYQQLNVDVLGVVENMSYFVAPDTGKEYDLFGRGGAERAAGELGVPFLGAIPINITIRVSGDAGTPQDVFASNPQGVTDAVEAMINNLEYFVQLKNRAAPRAVGLNITS